MDSSTAVAYLNNMGSTKSTKLNAFTLPMWEQCIQRTIWISAVHIAGITNTGADKQSCKFSDDHEWMLHKKHFQVILDKYSKVEIDLFVSGLNTQLTNYAAWHPDPGCVAVDAFTINWGTKMFYGFPPFSLIP